MFYKGLKKDVDQERLTQIAGIVDNMVRSLTVMTGRAGKEYSHKNKVRCQIFARSVTQIKIDLIENKMAW